jgi:hypothetical protein
MKSKFKLGALAWGIALAVAFPAGASAADNSAADCIQQATIDATAPDQCHQENTATNTQLTTTVGGAGGTATGGVSGPSLAVGDGAEASSEGGDASANGGDAEANVELENEQSNAISCRDSGYGGISGGSNGAVCVQQATGNTTGADQCHQSNTAINTQLTTTVGGAGGSATGGVSGPSLAVGNGASAKSQGGNASANGGDAESNVSIENRQSNQISGRDSVGDDSFVVNYTPKHVTTTTVVTPPAVTVVYYVYNTTTTKAAPAKAKAKAQKAKSKKSKKAKKRSNKKGQVKGEVKCVKRSC